MIKYFVLILSIICIAQSKFYYRENYFYDLTILQTQSQKNKTKLCQYLSEDKKKINCQIETGSFLPPSAYLDDQVPFQELKIVEYNIDRNGLGGDGPNEQGIKSIIESLQSFGNVDVIILSEVARDCPQWGYDNGAEEIARALHMDWAYSVEFLELKTRLFQLGYQCTIGNAILSNRPLSNIIQKSFDSQCCMFSGRGGSRAAIKATIQAYNLTVVSSHLESGTGFDDFIDAMLIREKQAIELTNMIDPIEFQENMIMIGGDFNSPLRQFSEGQVFSGFYDPFVQKYNWPNRNTCIGDELGLFGLSSFDYMYFKNHEKYILEGFICNTKECSGFSDHFPLKVKVVRR